MARSIETFNAQKLVDQLLAEKAKGIAEVFPGELASAQEGLAIKLAVDAKLAEQKILPVDSSAKIVKEEDKAKEEGSTVAAVSGEPVILPDSARGPEKGGSPNNFVPPQKLPNPTGDNESATDPMPVGPDWYQTDTGPAPVEKVERDPTQTDTGPGPAEGNGQTDPGPEGPDWYQTDTGPGPMGNESLSADDAAASDAPKVQAIHAVPNATHVISPRKNILDQYASYNYNIGWYLLPPALFVPGAVAPYDFRKYLLGGYYLLAQSGGAPTNTQGSQSAPNTTFHHYGPQAESGSDDAIRVVADRGVQRNPYFNLDYYIDTLDIETFFPGSATKLSNTHASIKFSLHEPNGITLTKNLFNAVQNVYGSQGTTQKISLASAHYALVIRFYGYDENGKIVTARDKDTTDSQAVVEKFIPFRLATINFRIANRVTQYEINGRPIPYSVAGSSSRGTIQSNISLMGSTVEDILVGKPVGIQYPAPDGRPSTYAPNVPSEATATGNEHRQFDQGPGQE